MTTTQDTIDLAKYNGKVTVLNTLTGGHRTFSIRTVKRGALKGRRVVALLTGQDNQSDYISFGFVNAGGTVYVWKTKQTNADGELSDYCTFARMLSNPERYPNCEYKMSVLCRCCNRELTTPESIDSGIGPVCAARI